MAPPMKDPSVRRRRNRSSTATTLLVGGGRRPPKLPDLGLDWHTQTREFWRDVWHSPMAGEFTQADLHGLHVLAVLVDAFWRNPSTQAAAEIRLQRQCFGLTPLDRRRLQWTVDASDDPAAAPRRSGSKTTPIHRGVAPVHPLTGRNVLRDAGVLPPEGTA